MGVVHNGDTTVYDTGLSKCGKTPGLDELVASVGQAIWDQITAAGPITCDHYIEATPREVAVHACYRQLEADLLPLGPSWV